MVVFFIAFIAVVFAQKNFNMEASPQPPAQEVPRVNLTPQAREKLEALDSDLEEALGDSGYTDFMLAVIMENENRVKEILAQNPEHVALANDYDFTPLHFAALLGNVGIMKLLLDHGAPVNASARQLRTPLDCAAWHKNHEAVALLLERGANVNASKMILDNAVDHGRIANAFLLLRHGARVYPALLQTLARLSNPIRDEMTRLLFMFGFKWPQDKIPALFPDPLERAVALGNLEEVRGLLEGTGQLSSNMRRWPAWIRNYFIKKYTPVELGRALSYAVARHPDIAKLLIGAGARLHEAEDVVEGILRAMISSDSLIWKQNLLRSRGLIMEAENDLDRTIRPPLSGQQRAHSYLQLLTPESFSKVVVYLHGQETLAQRDLQTRKTIFSQSLIEAVEGGNIEELQALLLSEGCNLNINNAEGIPLIWFAFLREPITAQKLIQLLLAHGAYPNPENCQGIRFLDFLAHAPQELLEPRREIIAQLLEVHSHEALQARFYTLIVGAQIHQLVLPDNSRAAGFGGLS